MERRLRVHLLGLRQLPSLLNQDSGAFLLVACRNFDPLEAVQPYQV